MQAYVWDLESTHHQVMIKPGVIIEYWSMALLSCREQHLQEVRKNIDEALEEHYKKFFNSIKDPVKLVVYLQF